MSSLHRRDVPGIDSSTAKKEPIVQNKGRKHCQKLLFSVMPAKLQGTTLTEIHASFLDYIVHISEVLMDTWHTKYFSELVTP